MEIQAVLNGYEEAYELCQYNFKLERWNCPKPEKVKNTDFPISLTSVYSNGEFFFFLLLILQSESNKWQVFKNRCKVLISDSREKSTFPKTLKKTKRYLDFLQRACLIGF